MLHKEPSGKFFYLILWGGAALIGVIMVIIWKRQEINDKQLLQNPLSRMQTLPGEAINDLLLSVDELTIEEKKSFISLYLKPDGKTGVVTYSNNNNRDEMYKLILQRKLNRVNRKSSDDFLVKPIPK